MKGKFNAGRRPSLKKRLESLRRQNRAIGTHDRSHRCAHCLAPLPVPAFTVFGSPLQYCSALCLPRAEAS
jgi:hypothetical protein